MNVAINRRPSTIVRYLRWFYVGWLGIIAGAIVLQFYLAGYGVFGFSGLNGFGAHLLVGDLIGFASLVGIGLALAAGMPSRITGVNAAFSALWLLQFYLAWAGVREIMALHVVNGVLIFIVVLYLTRASAKFVWSSVPAQEDPQTDAKRIPEMTPE